MGWAPAAGAPWWVVVGLVAGGGAIGVLTGRELRTGGYRVESDEAGELPRHWWWAPVVLAALWGWLGWRLGDLAGWAALPAYLLLAWVAVVLVWIDADVHRLPDGIVLPAYPALLALLVLATGGLGDWTALWRALAAMAVLYAVFFVLAFVSPGSLGFGDVKLAGVIGLAAGWLGVVPAFVAVFAGFVVGGLVALVLLVGRRVGLRSHIAYGPSMLVGAFLAVAVQYHV